MTLTDVHPGRRHHPIAALILAVCLLGAAARGDGVLVEAESFAETGGWVTDQQFMDVMGSPCLLAHGLGRPVADAVTSVLFPHPGRYRLWVRTRDWIPEPEWAPGRFTVRLDGRDVGKTFGTESPDWGWEDGGRVDIGGETATVALHDLTGFEGRCDALFFADETEPPPPAVAGTDMAAWRRRFLGLPETPPAAPDFDVVVVGGGLAGCAAAVTAARLGSRVALVQDRPVLGGNNSPEIRVHSAGAIHGPVVTREIDGEYRHDPGDPRWWAEPSGPTRAADRRQAVVEAEKNITLFLGQHVFRVETHPDGRIRSVDAADIRTSREVRFHAPLFIDCTGDGAIGFLAGADWRMGREARAEHGESLAPLEADAMTLGSSILWGAAPAPEPVVFPPVPWALAVSGEHAARSGNWRWEYGHFRDTIAEAETIRDHLFRAAYGSFASAEARGGDARGTMELRYMNYIAGKRESRRLLGEYILTQNDIEKQRSFPDAVAKGSFYVDLHEPTTLHGGILDWQIAIPDEVWAVTDGKRERPYEIPFRCLYSRNVPNLMMAGRCLSATHVAHASARLMKTGAQTGVAVGAAADLCRKYGMLPAAVRRKHIGELQDIVFARGAAAGALSPTLPVVSIEPLAPEPNPVVGLRVGVARTGEFRTADQYTLVELPPFCEGLPCVTIERRSNRAPAPAYTFAADKPVVVYLLVDDRGSVVPPAPWKKLDAEARWRAGSEKTYTDSVYRARFAAGSVAIPGHAGREGDYYAVPNMAIIEGPADVRLVVAPEP